MKKIPLTQNQFALVDDADYEWLNALKWSAHSDGYNVYAEHSYYKNGEVKHIAMHRLILGLQPGDGHQTDHINGNGLDNRRSNLRICSQLENSRNMKPRGNSNSKFKGVDQRKSSKKWRAQIRYNGSNIHLGYFDSELRAAEVYDINAKKLFGAFARPNFRDTAEVCG